MFLESFTLNSIPVRYHHNVVVSEDKLVGNVIDERYRIVARIARGGMATVYKAYDQRLEREVAIKIMHPHLAESTDFVARFKREARAAAKLTHPGVVGIYDQGNFEDTAYLVMEYVPGDDLRSLLENTPTAAPLGVALAILDSVIEAIGTAHRHGMVHRDIKPENILLDSRYGQLHTKVADFGLAKAVTEATVATTGTIMGTVAYLAPEIVTTGQADTRSDVYACGIILYELLLGHPPFMSDVAIRVAFQHVNDEIPAPSNQAPWIPAEIDQLVAAFTAKNPADRPADADAARAMLLATKLQIDPAILSKAQPLPHREKESVTTDIPIPTNTLPVTDTVSTNNATTIDKASSDNSTTTVHTPAILNENSTTPDSSSLPAPNYQQITELLTLPQHLETQKLDLPLPTTNNGHTTTSTSNEPTKKAIRQTKNLKKQNKTSNQLQKPKKKRKPLIVIVLLISLLVLGTSSFSAWWFLFGPGYGPVIPKVSGITIEQAKQAFTKAKINYEFHNKYSDDVAKDLLIDTQPAQGKRIKKDQTIQAFVSLGVEMVKVPTVTNILQADAEVLLKTAKLKTGKVTEAYHDTLANGKVISQSIAANTTVKHDTAVDLVISKGPEPITIPNVINKKLADVEKELTALGLKIKNTEVYDNDIPAGSIIKQDPVSGPGHRGDQLSLTISLGPEIIEVPNLYMLTPKAAQTKLENLGFKVQFKYSSIQGFGLVFRQSVNGGEKAPKGSTIVITIL